ncbi:microtubule-associated protein RP/EB family member 1-like [Dermacentor albipictus]|uniref:microtubule-associated protein RP/EB family member 1-like n=1 Tax=Dermacentor albipictus TaxID=60249 RepID=UPI0031FBEB92
MEDSAASRAVECSDGAVSDGAARCTPASALAENKTDTTALLRWINGYLGTRYGKVEDLCSGAAYCQFADMLFPGTIDLDKVNLRAAKRGREAVQNFEALREVFKEVGVDREVPVERLAGGNYRDNLELALWFKESFDAQYAVETADAAAGHATPLVIATSGPFASHTIVHEHRFTGASGNAEDARAAVDETGAAGPGRGLPPSRSVGVAAKVATCGGGGAGAGDFSDTVEELAGQVAELKDALYWLELERNFYYSKLCEIEVLCWEHEREHGKDDVTEQILDLMRASDDDDWYGEEEDDTAQSGELEAEVPAEEQPR